MVKKEDSGKSYWRATLRLLSIILAVWALVSFGASIIFVDTLNKITLVGYPLGFWFAQQGSIFIFIALIFIYVFFISRIDKKYDVHENNTNDGKEKGGAEK
jgi:putative solute:sodium symporter small subunit